MRRWTQRLPIATHSSHTRRRACLISDTADRCEQSEPSDMATPSFREDTMDERDGNGAFADRGRDTMIRPEAYIASCKNARDAGLQ